jgi:hypothetical protein
MGQLRKKKEIGNPSRTVPGTVAKEPKPDTERASQFTLSRFHRWNRLLLWFVIAIFAKYYYWTIHPNPSQPIPKFGLYWMVADAIAYGQTSLLVRPSAEVFVYQPESPLKSVA